MYPHSPPRVGYPITTSWGIYGRLSGDARTFFLGPYASADDAETVGRLLFMDKFPKIAWHVAEWRPIAHHPPEFYQWAVES